MDQRIGRRVIAVSEIELPGDYCRTDVEVQGEIEDCVFFLLPIARDEDVEPGARSLHQVRQPPHTFRECSDGSLEIRASIAAGIPHYWHGFLDEGHVWRQV